MIAKSTFLAVIYPLWSLQKKKNLILSLFRNSNLTFFYFMVGHGFFLKKFIIDFHFIPFPEDYKEQYIAEYLIRKSHSLDTNSNTQLAKLKKCIAEHAEKPWSHYYQAILEEQDQHESEMMYHALRAVSFGDLRASYLIIDYYTQQLPSITDSTYQTLVKHTLCLDEVDSSREKSRLSCLTYCLRARHPHMVQFIDQGLALDTMLEAFLPEDRNVQGFLTFLAEVLQLSGILSPAYTQQLVEESKFVNCETVFDVVKIILKRIISSSIIYTSLYNWVRQLNLSEHPIACYYQAELMRTRILYTLSYDLHNSVPRIDQELLEAVTYYKKAFAGREYRALAQCPDNHIGGLYSLLGIKPALELIDKETFRTMLHEGAHKGKNVFCIHVLACYYLKETHWDRDPFKVWTIQQSAGYLDNHGQNTYTALIDAASHPDKYPYVHCALSLLYAHRGEEAQSFEAYQFAVSIHPTLPARYIAHGKKSDLATQENVQIFLNHQLKLLENTSTRPTTSTYYLRKHP